MTFWQLHEKPSGIRSQFPTKCGGDIYLNPQILIVYRWYNTILEFAQVKNVSLRRCPCLPKSFPFSLNGVVLWADDEHKISRTVIPIETYPVCLTFVMVWGTPNRNGVCVHTSGTSTFLFLIGHLFMLRIYTTWESRQRAFLEGGVTACSFIETS